MLAGLAFLAERRIVHSDIKSANIMLCPSSAAECGLRAKIIDFGVAVVLTDAEPTYAARGDAVSGTPNWMAPELVNAAPAGTGTARC